MTLIQIIRERVKQAALLPDVKLQPQQERVVEKINKEPALLVYHSLGSGKTLSSLASGESIAGPKTVVVPAALRENYRKEIAKFTDQPSESPDYNISSYNKAVSKGLPEAGLTIFDEAHRMGRDSTKISKLPTQAKNKVMFLTGTPVRNDPAEFVPLLKVLGQGRNPPGSHKAFREKFVEEVTVNPSWWQSTFHGVKPGTIERLRNQKELHRLIKGRVDYHPLEGEFPRVDEEDIEVEMTPKQTELYEAFLNENSGLAHKVKRNLPPSKSESVKLNAFLSAVRQLSNNPKPFDMTLQGSAVAHSPKLRRMLGEIYSGIDKDPNFKGVVYSNYLQSGIMPLAKALEKKGIPHAVFTGGLKDSERRKIVDNYNSGKTKVLLVSSAGSEGLDLRGTKLMQLMEPHWNQARLDQMVGRTVRHRSHAHLPEAERVVKVQRFFSNPAPGMLQRWGLKEKDTGADRYMANLSDTKQQLISQFLDVLKKSGSMPALKAAHVTNLPKRSDFTGNFLKLVMRLPRFEKQAIENTPSSSHLYRYTADGTGVWQRAKERVTKEEWEDILRKSTWLLKPTDYPKGGTSYFTEEGRNQYLEHSSPLLSKHLPNIKEEVFDALPPGLEEHYSDALQVVGKPASTEKVARVFQKIVADFKARQAAQPEADNVQQYKKASGEKAAHVINLPKRFDIPGNFLESVPKLPRIEKQSKEGTDDFLAIGVRNRQRLRKKDVAKPSGKLWDAVEPDFYQHGDRFVEGELSEEALRQLELGKFKTHKLKQAPPGTSLFSKAKRVGIECTADNRFCGGRMTPVLGVFDVSEGDPEFAGKSIAKLREFAYRAGHRILPNDIKFAEKLLHEHWKGQQGLIGIVRRRKLLTALAALGLPAAGYGTYRLFKKEAKDDYAIGLPDPRRFGDVKQLPPGEVLKWVVQRHLADRAGPHYDVRFGREGGKPSLYSWATRKELPEPGGKIMLYQQPLHRGQYAEFEGELTEGYGKGTVKKHDYGNVIVTKAERDKIQFVVTHKKFPEVYTMIRMSGPPNRPGTRSKSTQGGSWLMINTTPVSAAKILGGKPEEVGMSKLKYSVVPADKVDKLFDPNYMIQEKVDGASALYHLMGDRIEALSYRISKTGRPIVYTYKIFGPGGAKLNLPKQLQGTIVRGEVYGEREGKAISAQELGGLLNATITNSLQKQKEQNVQMKTMLFDVVRYGKEPIKPNTLTGEERMGKLQEIMKYLPPSSFRLPETARTPETQKALYDRIVSEQHPYTREGIVAWPATKPGRAIKVKPRPEQDVWIQSVFPGKGKYENSAGGFEYSLSPDGPIVGKVGGGFDDSTRKQMMEEAEDWKGRLARITATEKFPSGAYRNPSFVSLHHDYPLLKTGAALIKWALWRSEYGSNRREGLVGGNQSLSGSTACRMC